VLGFGLPPGTFYNNKWGEAYNNLNDISFIRLPNGKELFVAVFTDAYANTETTNPSPYNLSSLGLFAEMLIEQLGLDAGDPPKIKLDNTDATFAGTWTSSSSSADKYLTNYQFSNGGTGANTATYNLNAPQTGQYELCAWFPQGCNRATDVHYIVNSSSGAHTVFVNQQSKGGRWVRLGDFQFNAGQGSVVITDQVSDTSKVVIADGIKATMWPTSSAVKSWKKF
jgi:hypothetical protein